MEDTLPTFFAPCLVNSKSMRFFSDTVFIETCVYRASKATTKNFHGHFHPTIARQ